MVKSSDKSAPLSVTRGKEPGILLDFIDALYTDGMKRDTAYNYYMTARSLAKFLKKWRKNIPCAPEEVVMKRVDAQELLDITQEEWERYLNYYKYASSEANGSLAVRISVIRKLYRWLGETTGTPVPRFIERAKRPTPNPEPHQLITEKTEKVIFDGLRGTMHVRNACIISLILDCGLGLDEVTALQLEDLEIDRIRIRGEDGRTRYIALSERSKTAIDEYLPERIPPIDGGNALFVSSKRGQLRRGAVQKMLRKSLKASGYAGRKISFRDLQQTSLEKRASEEGLEGIAEASRVNSIWYLKDKYDLVGRRNKKKPTEIASESVTLGV